MLKSRLAARFGLFGALLALFLQAFLPAHPVAAAPSPALPFADAVICGVHPDGDGAPPADGDAASWCFECCVPNIVAASIPSPPAVRTPQMLAIASATPADSTPASRENPNLFQARAPPPRLG
jgi:hypothetical protein